MTTPGMPHEQLHEGDPMLEQIERAAKTPKVGEPVPDEAPSKPDADS